MDRSMNGFSTGGLRDLINGRIRAERERNVDYDDEEDYYEHQNTDNQIPKKKTQNR